MLLRRPTNFTSFLILSGLAALYLRCHALTFGLPHFYRPDEDLIIGPALQISRGSFDPQYYFYPGAMMYISGLLIALFSFLSGEFSGMPSLFTAQDACLLGRALSVVAALSSLVVLYIFTSRHFGKEIALSAFGITAFHFLHIRDAHFFTLDSPLTLVTLLTLWALCELARNVSHLNAWRAGAFFGLTVAVKYSGLSLLPVFFLALFCTYKKNTSIASISLRFLLAAIAVFIVFNPYALLRFEEFSAAFQAVQHYAGVGLGIPPSGIPWMLEYGIPYGVGSLLFLCGVAGAIYLATECGPPGLLREPARLLIPFHLFIGILSCTATKHIFLRYLLPIIPCFAICAAVLMQRFFGQRLKAPILTAAIVTILFSGAGCLRAFTLSDLLNRTDSRTLATNWIKDSLPVGTQILVTDHAWYKFSLPQLPPGISYMTYRRELGDPCSLEAFAVIMDMHPGLPHYSPKFPPDVLSRILACSDPAHSILALKADAKPVMEPADGFYAPLAEFNGVQRPGPNLEIRLFRRNA